MGIASEGRGVDKTRDSVKVILPSSKGSREPEPRMAELLSPLLLRFVGKGRKKSIRTPPVVDAGSARRKQGGRSGRRVPELRMQRSHHVSESGPLAVLRYTVVLQRLQ